jgi:uncharacterized protein YjbI with pentapeptide repeats
MSDQPDYVNDLPDGFPADTPRCQCVFRYSHEYGEQDVQGRMCGLPVPDDDFGNHERRCYFHSVRARTGDSKLKDMLEESAGLPAYLGEARLPVAQLQGASLDGALLQHARLANARLMNANLLGAQLQGANLFAAKLQDAKLSGDAQLQGANLNSAQLQRAELYGTQLQGAKLREAQLQGARLVGAQLRGADLRGAHIGVLQLHDPETNTSTRQATNLSGADLTGALLTRATIESEANLSGTVIDPIIRDEFCARDDTKWATTKDLHGGGRPTFEECEATYRQLKLNFQESGDYQRAGEFYLREMECRRAQAWKNRDWGGCLLLSALYHLCGYGERPWKALRWALAVLVISSFPLGWMGIMCGERVMAEPGIALPSWAGLKVFFWAFCLSLASLVGGDLGQLRTVSPYGDCVLAVETAIGWLLLSIFMVALARKFSR